MTQAASWEGFRRPDGTVGARNVVLVVPGGIVPGEVCRWVPGTVTVTTADRGYGRSGRDRARIARTAVGARSERPGVMDPNRRGAPKTARRQAGSASCAPLSHPEARGQFGSSGIGGVLLWNGG